MDESIAEFERMMAKIGFSINRNNKGEYSNRETYLMWLSFDVGVSFGKLHETRRINRQDGIR